MFFAVGILLYFYYASSCLVQPVPYLKAIDLFVGVCLCFALVALTDTTLMDNFYKIQEGIECKTHENYRKIQALIYWTDISTKAAFPLFLISFALIFKYSLIG